MLLKKLAMPCLDLTPLLCYSLAERLWEHRLTSLNVSFCVGRMVNAPTSKKMKN